MSNGLRALIRLVVLVIAAEQFASATIRAMREVANPDLRNPVYWHAAQAMRQEGLKAGNGIALISDQPWGEGGPFVARLDRLQVVAQVNSPSVFWAAPHSTQSQVLEVLVGTGAKAVVSWGEKLPPAGWERLGGTDYFIYLLR